MSATAEHDPDRASLSTEQKHWLRALSRTVRAPLRRATVAPLLGGALLIGQAWLLARVIEQAVVHGAGLDALLPSLVAIVGLILTRALLSRWGDVAGAQAAETAKHLLRQALFDRQLALGPQWSRQAASGEVATAVVDQVDAIEGYLSRYLPARTTVAILPLAFSVFLMPTDWVVGVLLLITAPLIPLFMALVGWGAQAASQRHMRAMARLSGIFADRLRGLVTLRLYGRAQAEADTVGRASDDLRQRTMSVLRIAFLSSAVLEFFAALGVAGVALYVGLTYLEMIDLRGGSAFALQAGLFCLLMAPEVYAPLRQFAAHYHDGEAAKAAVSEIARAFDGLPALAADVADSRHEADLPQRTFATAGATLRVRALTLTRPVRRDHDEPDTPAAPTPVADTAEVPGTATVVHSQLSPPAPPTARLTLLCDLNFDISPGEHVALLGESGSGKSTLLEALAGLGLEQDGITLDGQPLAAVPQRLLRQRVACLGQRPHLFHGSIADNIRLGWQGASDEDVRTAAALAGVDDIAARLPQGLATQIGTRGFGLSGGEVQRVALARIFLRDPELILLDEPTASLDDATQARVLDAILRFAQGRTLIVATHARAVAQRMHRVLRIDGATLTEDRS